MVNLLSNEAITLLKDYTITDILTIILLVLFLIVSVWKAIDFFKEKVKNKHKTISEVDLLEKRVDNIDSKYLSLKEDIATMHKDINRLLSSDKDAIKSWITEKYHYHMKQGYIDDYSLDCLEKRFTHYKDEGGNSFIEGMMEDLRDLPHCPEE